MLGFKDLVENLPILFDHLKQMGNKKLNSDIAIQLNDVSKSFRIYDKPHHRILQSFSGKNKRYFKEFWALKNISFEIKRGETVGIVGRNGAGKSTLLQIISSILTPTNGSVEVSGRVAALLELGAGFNPQFTGRENVFMYATVLGLSRREIEEKYEDILAFADIGEFIEQPVKSYSSGMFMRLAFAVTTCVDPDVLIVDEALGVGDVRFQAKCFRRFDELVSNGTTVLFVTHSTEQIVRHCPWSILLDGGELREVGDSKKIANIYLDLMFGERRTEGKKITKETRPNEFHADILSDQETQGFESRENYNHDEYRWGTGEARIVDFLVTRDGKNNETVVTGENPFSLLLFVEFEKEVPLPIYGVTIKTPDGVTVYRVNSREFKNGPLFEPAKIGSQVKVKFNMQQRLGTGDYLVSVGVAEQIGGEVKPLDRRYDAICLKISDDMHSYGLVNLSTDVEIV